MRDLPEAPAPPEAEPGYTEAGQPASEEDPRLDPDEADNE
jgi:hypothetical protein